MKKIRFVILLIAVFSFKAVADPFSGSATAAHMAELVRQAKLQIEEARKQLSVLENLREMQQMKEVAYLSGTGESLGSMFSDARSIGREVGDWREDAFGTNQIVNDYERMQRQAQNADGMGGIDRGSTYASMLTSLNRLKWLGKAQEDMEKKLAEGNVSDLDREAMATEALITMNALFLEREAARQRQQAIDTEIFMDSMDGLNYGNMGLMK